MFENFRERLQTVQQDFTTGIKTLSDKSREAKISKNQRRGENFSQFTAGLELLSRYEDTWMTLHKRTKECTTAGEAVDGEVVMLAAHWEKRRSTLVQLQEQLQQMPTFLANLESITTLMAHLEADFEEMESRLLRLEDLCGQCEQQRLKQNHALQLENYKKKKRKELEALKADLDVEHTQKVLEMEHTQQVKLKERQKFFEEAFQQDMEQYLSTGYLQIAERREPIGSMSSMEVNVDVLEQMDLMDVSDQEALDVFLNSGLEDSSVTSPMQEPMAEALGADVTLQVPTRAEQRHKLSSLSSSCSDSGSLVTEGLGEASDGTSSPAVQSDEEEVQADTLPESEAPPSSDDSDSAAS